MSEIRIRFDGPPEHTAGRFVDVEDESGAGVSVGRWVQDGDYWLLVMDDPRALRARIATLERQVEQAREALAIVDEQESKPDFAQWLAVRSVVRHALQALREGGENG